MWRSPEAEWLHRVNSQLCHLLTDLGSLVFLLRCLQYSSLPFVLGCEIELPSQAPCRHHHSRLEQPRGVKRLLLLMHFFTSDKNVFRSLTEDSVSHWPGMWRTTTHPLKHKAEGERKPGESVFSSEGQGGWLWAGDLQCRRRAGTGGSPAAG